MFPAMNITNNNSNKAIEDLPIFTEILIDFETGEPILLNGNVQIVEKIEALKIWAWKAINTERYRFQGDTWNYGSEFENLIGQGLNTNLMNAELQRNIEDVLLVNPYITGVKNLSFSIDGSKVYYKFSLITIYGEEAE